MKTDLLALLLRGTFLSWDRMGQQPAAFCEACRDEGISGLLMHNLRDTPELASWPAAVRDGLSAASRAAVARELLAQRELARVLEALDRRGVHPLLFKGAALAYTVYPHPSLRTRADTDLLIRPGDADAVRQELSGLGYRPSLQCDGELLFRQFELARDDEFGVTHALDFHWGISTQAAFAGVLGYEEMAQRAVAVPRLGRSARATGTLDALLLALIHPVMHHRNQRRLLWSYDVHLLTAGLEHDGFDQLANRARARGVAAVCAQGLRQARDWFGTPVPQPLLDRLEAVPLGAQPTAAYLAPGRSWARETADSLRGLPRWRDRMRLLKEIALPPPAYVLGAYGLPPSRVGMALLPALYLHRGARGVWRVISGRK